MHMLDRAARVLAVPQDWTELDDVDRDLWRVRVRQILKALHEPDDRIAEAGAEVVRNVGREESEAAYLNDAANVWRFMIDALLSAEK